VILAPSFECFLLLGSRVIGSRARTALAPAGRPSPAVIPARLLERWFLLGHRGSGLLGREHNVGSAGHQGQYQSDNSSQCFHGLPPRSNKLLVDNLDGTDAAVCRIVRTDEQQSPYRAVRYYS